MIAHRNHSANTMLAIDGPKSQRRDTHRPFLAEHLCGRDARRCGRGNRRTVTGQNQRSCPDLDYDVGEAENTGTAHQPGNVRHGCQLLWGRSFIVAYTIRHKRACLINES